MRLPILLDVAKGQDLFSPQWEKEAGRCEGALPASVGMAITPLTTSDTPAPPARLQQPAPSLARLVSPGVSQLANGWHSGTVSIS